MTRVWQDVEGLRSPWPQTPGRMLAAFVWALPYALVGFLAWLAMFLAFQASAPRWRAGAAEVACRGAFGQWMAARGWGAFTLGWTVFHWLPLPDEQPATEIAKHELGHVRQALRLGALYPFLYLISWACSASCPNMDAYRDNVFERDATRGTTAGGS